MINVGDSAETVKTKIADALALDGITPPTSWADATIKLNAYGLPPVLDGQDGTTARARINAVISYLEALNAITLGGENITLGGENITLGKVA